MNYMGGKTVKITDIKKFQLTNSMEQSTPEGCNSHLASQEIPNHLQNLKIHKNQVLTILSHLKPVHNLTPYFFKIHFNTILPSMPRSLKWSLCKQKFHAKLPCCIYPCNFPGTIVII